MSDLQSTKREGKVTSILKAFSYLVLYLAIQCVLVYGFLFTYLLLHMGEFVTDGELSVDRLESLLLQATEAVNSQTMLLTLAADALVVAIIWILIICRKNPEVEAADRRLFRKIPFSWGFLSVCIGIFCNLALNIVMNLLPEQILEDYGSSTEAYETGGLWLYILAAVILAPICEELVFRGMMVTRLSRAFPRMAAVLAVGILFGVIHGNLVQGIYAGLLGVLLGILFTRGKDSLLVSILVHFGFNLTSVPSYLISYTNLNPFRSATFSNIYRFLTLASIPLLVLSLLFFFKSTASSKRGDEMRISFY